MPWPNSILTYISTRPINKKLDGANIFMYSIHQFFFSKITIKVLSFYFMAQIFSQICDKFLNEDRCWCSFVWTRWRHQNFKETDIDQFSSAKIHSRKRLVWYNAFLLIFVFSSVLILVYESSSHVRPPQRTPNLIIVWCQRVKYKIQS